MQSELAPELKLIIADYPVTVQRQLMVLRQEIFQVAKHTEGVGELTETSKWGELAYLTEQSKSGSTLRIDWKVANPDYIGLYVNCQTHLVASFGTLFPGLFCYQKQRAILLGVDQAWPLAELKICIAMALRYHLDKTH
ncbi:DUF1801 domain-containing protein [Agarivorans sp. 1_MG-2023]|uniref:DUF1801 domain-containing protein n=1 Tax=Agarivorans sp. 1_MG-2023 TaxID=3062634 RepID=UPI0026E12C03|nr:DUF1801 domain-containing protein [Agarivorans sp. 1_MG-2023]MDO6764944.1 DUF1801 domain-containing protein [Agarivorans sp. 1_MG-2023]